MAVWDISIGRLTMCLLKTIACKKGLQTSLHGPVLYDEIYIDMRKN